MDDLEMTKLCAIALGRTVARHPLNIDITEPAIWTHGHNGNEGGFWNPLSNDAQAMALVKKFDLSLWGHSYAAGAWKYHAEWGHPDDSHALGHGLTHNQAIVECVAKMMAARTPVATKVPSVYLKNGAIK